MFQFDRFYAKLDLLEGGGASGGGAAGANTGVGDGAANGAGGASAGGNGATGGLSWDTIKATLPDDLKSDGSLEPIKDIQGLVKGFVHAQKMIGRGNIPIPDAKHATQEDWLQVFKKLGAPDKVEDLKFKLPDGAKEDQMDPELLKSVKEAAVQAGVMPWQFEKIFNTFYGYADKQVKDSEESFKAKATEDVNSLKIAWGAAFDTQVKKANVALKELVPDEADRQRLLEDGLGSHPVLLKALANAAKYFKEDQFLGQGEGALTGMTPQDAERKAREIMGDSNHPYRRPDHPNHKAAKKEVQDLWKVAYPG